MSIGTRTATTAMAGMAALAAAPAFAHPGAHHGMGLTELAQHLGSAWHILPVLAVAAVTAGLLVVRHRRSVKASSVARDRRTGS